MKLSTFSDFSLRVLMFLAAEPDRMATIGEIAGAHRVSEAHLMKVVHHLAKAGYLETLRGKGGGLRLARPASDINLGEVIRCTETTLDLVGCLSDDGFCAIQGHCRLAGILNEASQALFLVFDGYSLADLISPGAPAPSGLAAT